MEHFSFFHLLTLLIKIVSWFLKILLHQFRDLCLKISCEVNYLLVACVCFKLLDIPQLGFIHRSPNLLCIKVEHLSSHNHEKLRELILNGHPSSVPDEKGVLRL